MQILLCDFTNGLEITKDIFTILAIVIGGGWTLWRFRRFRERHSKMELSLGYKYLGRLKEFHVVELNAELRNKGLASQQIFDFEIELFSFKEVDKYDEKKGLIYFTTRLFKSLWLSDELYVDGGTNQRFTYLTFVPIENEYLSLCSKFYFSKRDEKIENDFRTFMSDRITFSTSDNSMTSSNDKIEQ